MNNAHIDKLNNMLDGQFRIYTISQQEKSHDDDEMVFYVGLSSYGQFYLMDDPFAIVTESMSNAEIARRLRAITLGKDLGNEGQLFYHISNGVTHSHKGDLDPLEYIIWDEVEKMEVMKENNLQYVQNDCEPECKGGHTKTEQN